MLLESLLKITISMSSQNKSPGPDVIKHLTCSNHLAMKFVLVINFKIPTRPKITFSDILTNKIASFVCILKITKFMLMYVEHEKFYNIRALLRNINKISISHSYLA